jgi:hypothetical protein
MILSLLRVKDFEMEDMMRSSFAEFHSQKQHPDVVKAREAASAQLAQLKENPWPEGVGRCVSPSVSVASLCTTCWQCRPRGTCLQNRQ